MSRREHGAGEGVATKSLAPAIHRLRAFIPIETRILVALGFIGLGLFLFIHLASEVIEGDTMAFDRASLLALRVPGKPWEPIGPHWLSESFMQVTALGSRTNLTLITTLVVAYLIAARRPGPAIFVIAATSGGAILSALLKTAFERPRPEIVPHLVDVASASFPSGHALNSSVTYLTLGILLARTERSRPVRVYLISAAIALSVLIGVSRVYLGVHWPSDVLAGWCIGSTWAFACWLAVDVIQDRRSRRGTR
ncbi:MAG TPA: phosphatase PAP2 family protein [Sphingomicrobium sp.]|nr:phosphatase PAP2 family protein [Sphingomicrobium sp.]